MRCRALQQRPTQWLALSRGVASCASLRLQSRCTLGMPRDPRMMTLLSSSRRASSTPHAGTEVCVFRLQPADAIRAFDAWQRATLPLPGWAASRVTSLTPTYAPFWCFHARGTQLSFILGGAVSVYAGAGIPRPLAELVVSPDLSSTRAFSSHALDVGAGVTLRNGKPSHALVVEPYHLYESTAYDLARAQLERQPRLAGGAITSRRVLSAAYIVQYSCLGVELHALINGATGAVWGMQQESASARAFSHISRTVDAAMAALRTNSSGIVGGLGGGGALLQWLADSGLLHNATFRAVAAQALLAGGFLLRGAARLVFAQIGRAHV